MAPARGGATTAFRLLTGVAFTVLVMRVGAWAFASVHLKNVAGGAFFVGSLVGGARARRATEGKPGKPLPWAIAALSLSALVGWAIAGLVWSGIFLFFPLFNRDRLRVGDLVAGTWVVHAPRKVLDVDLAATPTDFEIVFTTAALDAYGIKELSVLEDVLRRSDPDTMKAVAARIRNKIGFVGNVPDAAFLRAYYKGLRGRLEGRLLFGRRRKDKYDTV